MEIIVKNSKLFQALIIFTCMYGGICHGMERQEISEKQVAKFKKKLPAKAVLGSFYFGDYGANKTLAYFSTVLPKDLEVSVAANPARGASSYQNTEINSLKRIYKRASQGEKVIGSQTYGFGTSDNSDYLKSIDESQKKKIVLGGFCKGANVVCTMVAKHKEELISKNLAGLFLESPITSIGENLDYVCFYIPQCLRNLMHKIYVNGGGLKCPAYSKNGVHPIDMVKNLPDIPVLFIISKNDRFIPSCLSLQLAKKVADAGHKEIYVYIYDGKKITFYKNTAALLKGIWNAIFMCFPPLNFKIDWLHGVAYHGPRGQKEYRELMQNFISMCSDPEQENAQKKMLKYKKMRKELVKLEKEANTWGNYILLKDSPKIAYISFAALYFGYVILFYCTGNEPVTIYSPIKFFIRAPK